MAADGLTVSGAPSRGSCQIAVQRAVVVALEARALVAATFPFARDGRILDAPEGAARLPGSKVLAVKPAERMMSSMAATLPPNQLDQSTGFSSLVR